MSYIEKEKLIKADIESIENRVRHAFNQGYDLGYKEGKEKAKPQESTIDCMDRRKATCYTCRLCKIHNHGDIYCALREKGGQCIGFDNWESQEDVLDKIRAEIETKYGRCTLVEYFVQYDGICTGRKDIGDIADILQIIDKYKAESEG